MAAKGQHVGYIRVSSYDQSADRQLDGIELDRVFTDKASGSRIRCFERYILAMAAETRRSTSSGKRSGLFLFEGAAMSEGIEPSVSRQRFTKMYIVRSDRLRIRPASAATLADKVWASARGRITAARRLASAQATSDNLIAPLSGIASLQPLIVTTH